MTEKNLLRLWTMTAKENIVKSMLENDCLNINIIFYIILYYTIYYKITM